MRLFLDANVLFTAAHRPQGKAALICELTGEETWSLVTSELAIEEARRNLMRKFPQCLQALDTILQRVERVSPSPPFDCPVPLPEKDQPIFAGALRAAATHFLTGDRKHFGCYMNDADRTGGVVVQTVADFLDAL